MDEHDKRTTIGYWLLLTLAALLVRIVAAFFVFGAEPERSRPARLRRPGPRDGRGRGPCDRLLLAARTVLRLGAVLSGVRDVGVRRSGELDLLRRWVRPGGGGHCASGAPPVVRGETKRLGCGLLSARRHALGLQLLDERRDVRHALRRVFRAAGLPDLQEQRRVFAGSMVLVGGVSRFRGPYAAFVREHPAGREPPLGSASCSCNESGRGPSALRRAYRRRWRRVPEACSCSAWHAASRPLSSINSTSVRGGAYRPTTRRHCFTATTRIRPTTRPGIWGRRAARPSTKRIWRFSPARRTTERIAAPGLAIHPAPSRYLPAEDRKPRAGLLGIRLYRLGEH